MGTQNNEPPKKPVKEVVILSVPHTGTNLLQKILEKNGFVASPWCRQPDYNPSYRVNHLTDLGATQRAIQTGCPIIVPLRHPYRVEESWRRRNKDLDPFFEAWQILRDVVMRHEPFLFPVDVPGRDSHLERLSEWLGRPLETNWPLCRALHGTHDLDLEDTRPSADVVKMVEDMSEIFDQFY